MMQTETTISQKCTDLHISSIRTIPNNHNYNN